MLVVAGVGRAAAVWQELVVAGEVGRRVPRVADQGVTNFSNANAAAGAAGPLTHQGRATSEASAHKQPPGGVRITSLHVKQQLPG